MNPYLEHTQHAAMGIFRLLLEERNQLQQKQKGCRMMFDAGKSLFESMKLSGFDSTGLIDLDGYETARKRFEKEAVQIEALIVDLQPTYETLAGALLQIAKQGISVNYASLATCPDGRMIGTRECLKNVIWQGRNQTMHYEAQTYHPPITACFTNLESDFGSKFLLGNRNLALHLIDLLSWQTYQNYENDMTTLLT